MVVAALFSCLDFILVFKLQLASKNIYASRKKLKFIESTKVVIIYHFRAANDKCDK
jgi:hypothetical protein